MTQSTRPPYEIAAYFPEWEVKRPYLVKHIEQAGSASQITILLYAFGEPNPNPDSGAVVCTIIDPQAAYGQVYSADMSLDGQPDDPNQPLRGHFNQLKKLKAKYPQIKVLVSLGGWTTSTWFSDAAETEKSRRVFVESCIDLYLRGDLPEVNGAGGKGAAAGVFDGIDLDWEYPIGDGLPETHVRPEDGDNYVLLCKEFRRQYEQAGRPDFWLTMAGPSRKQSDQYHLPEAHLYLDLVSVMTYDMHSVWDALSNHHTNLFNSAQDPEARPMSADDTLHTYLAYGIPPEKLLIGAAFYGRAWQDVGAEQNGLYQPGAPLTNTGGSNYRDLIRKIGAGYTRFWDQSAAAPWLYSPSERIFWTFDDPQSLELKAQYVRSNHLGGVMFWEISGDDEQGSLVNSIYRGLNNTAR